MCRASSAAGFSIWTALFVAMVVPLAVAASSPLLQWRGAAYIVAGLAGVVGLALLLVQSPSVAGRLPSLRGRAAARAHVWLGAMLVVGVVVHVGGLFIATPPDVIDALLPRSPTPFSVWGVVAMWAVLASAALAFLRHREVVRPVVFRSAHLTLAAVVVAGTIVHALLIEGTMGTVSKIALCILVAAVNVWVLMPRLASVVRRLRWT